MKCLKEGRGTQGGGETGTKLRASLKHAQWHSLKGKQQRSRLKDVEEGENTEERRGWRRGERLGRDTSSRQSALRLRVNISPRQFLTTFSEERVPGFWSSLLSQMKDKLRPGFPWVQAGVRGVRHRGWQQEIPCCSVASGAGPCEELSYRLRPR